MQDSNRITLLGVIKFNFKTNSPIAEQITLPPHPEVTVSKKNLYLLQILHCIPCEVLKWREKIFKYTALNIIRTNATKGKR